ncbi:iron dicitrate transport regulator FecR [Sphingomonas koreensis]|nr:iron dicitrate transport regulator FecR [Sphingomonas koreensis]
MTGSERHLHGANGRAMDDRDTEIVEAAVAWQQAISRDDGDMDWEALTGWLEADPRHRAAFDELALIDAGVDEHRFAIQAILQSRSNEEEAVLADHRRSTGRRRWFLGTGIAAALVLAIGLPLMRSDDTAPTGYSTGPGATRSLALADGSHIELSAASAISVGPRDHQVAMLRGAAYFEVPHDPGRQLVVTAGRYRIDDIGTRFSVDLAKDRISIAVAEGNITVTPPTGALVPLARGERLTGKGTTPSTITQVAPDAIASWRRGRLIYDNASLGNVANDISRYTGKRIDLAEALDGRRFSGVLVIGDGSHLVSDLAEVAGLEVERDGARIVLSPARG